MNRYIERTIDVVAAHDDRGCFNCINQVMADLNWHYGRLDLVFR